MDGTFFMPPKASTFAGAVDSVYYFVYWLSVFFFVLIIGLMILFVVRYRRRSAHDKTPRITHSTALEVFWSIIPLFLIMMIFYFGFRVYLNMRVPPHGAMEIGVTAKRWMWEFTYPDGTKTVNEIAVPLGRPVKLLMTSQDVIHSFFVPSMRVKQDVVPNRYTVLWFEPTLAGKQRIYCAEYCGDGHSEMFGWVNVMPQEEFKEWLAAGGVDAEGLSPAQLGQSLFTGRGCAVCHTVDGSASKQCPDLLGIFGHEVQLADGSTVLVDENYLRQSMMEPNARVVSGYQPVMPSYAGLLKDEHTNAIVAYIKSLSGVMEEEAGETPAAAGDAATTGAATPAAAGAGAGEQC